MATQLVDASKAEVEARIAELQAQLEAEASKLLDFVPIEPEGHGAVIRFYKWQSLYNYAAIKVGRRWFVTQDGSRTARQGVPPKSWTELLTWIGERNWGSIEVLS